MVLEQCDFLPDEWSHIERRILRLPFGVTSPDIALGLHQANVLEYILAHGGDHVVADPDTQGQQRIPYGKGNVPYTPSIPTPPAQAEAVAATPPSVARAKPNQGPREHLRPCRRGATG